ncbi:hypothetical protein Ancab_002681 [Ancistrocladus abbreviatus]
MSSNFSQNSDSCLEAKFFSSFKFRVGDAYLLERCTGKFWDRCDGEVDSSFSISENGGFCGSVVGDVVDLLPVDPFEMDVATTIQAITGRLEDFEDENESKMMELEGNEIEIARGGDELFAGLNLVCRGTLTFMPEEGTVRIDEKSPEYSIDKFIVASGLDEFLSFTHEADLAASFPVDESQARTSGAKFSDADGGAPHDAFFLALGYLGVQDLFSVERVCKSLNEAVKNDPLLWMNIQIYFPLSERITDDALVKLAGRARGHLKSLTLIQCSQITDGGLQRVLQSNPEMTKLSVPGCWNIIKGILKTLKSTGAQGIKQLRIGRHFDITDEEYDELKFLLGLDKQLQSMTHKPRYFPSINLYQSADDDRAIDIEKCPRCQKLNLVYDCPAESCQKKQASQPCRACILCIDRCICCGCCIYDCDYDETFFLESLCLDCGKKLVTCQERQVKGGAPFLKHPVFCQETEYRFCLYG